MLKKILLTAISALAAASAGAVATEAPGTAADAAAGDTTATVTAEKCFVVAPPEVFQIVLPNTRMDMIDYYKAGMDRASTNAAGGECSIISLEPQSLTLKAGDGIRYQFFVVEGKKKPYIGVIETLSTPGDDSSVRFYTTDWTAVDTDKKGFFREPQLKDWMNTPDKSAREQAEETLPFVLTSYTYDPASQTLTATNNMGGYYHPTDTPDALSKMKHTITYKWDAKRDAFVMEKK